MGTWIWPRSAPSRERVNSPAADRLAEESAGGLKLQDSASSGRRPVWLVVLAEDVPQALIEIAKRSSQLRRPPVTWEKAIRRQATRKMLDPLRDCCDLIPRVPLGCPHFALKDSEHPDESGNILDPGSARRLLLHRGHRTIIHRGYDDRRCGASRYEYIRVADGSGGRQLLAAETRARQSLPRSAPCQLPSHPSRIDAIVPSTGLPMGYRICRVGVATLARIWHPSVLDAAG